MKIPIHDVWRQLSQSIGGLYSGDHFFEPPMVRLDHGPWAIFLSCVSANTGSPVESVFTVIYAAYQPRQLFSLHLRPFDRRSEGICPDGEAMNVGLEHIDDRFVVCSTHPVTARSLLSFSDMSELLARQPGLRLRIGSNLWHSVQDPRIDARYAENFEEIEFRHAGVIREARVLKSLFDMMTMLLDQMLAFDLMRPDMPDLDAPLREAYKRGGSWTTRWGRVPIPDL
ncbi:MAG: hypothetical protein ACOCX3_02120 [Chloroflexota bacterium]